MSEQRTFQQNKALHKYCNDLAIKLGDEGFEQLEVFNSFKVGFDIPWTMDAIKNIFRTVAKAMYNCESTKDLTAKQIQDVYCVVDARISQITGVRVEWPSEEGLMFESRGLDEL